MTSRQELEWYKSQFAKYTRENAYYKVYRRIYPKKLAAYLKANKVRVWTTATVVPLQRRPLHQRCTLQRCGIPLYGIRVHS